jgi:hypothetical protein
MLLMPLSGHSSLQDNVSDTTNELGVTLTASGSIHTKGSWASLLDPTSYESFGITVAIWGLAAAASTNARALADVGIGPTGGGSEQVLIPDLLCGNAGQFDLVGGGGAIYHFPIYIPAGVRLSGRLQGLIASETCTMAIWLHQWALGAGDWVGTRVTAYGPNTATSSGVSHTPGNNAYATATQIVASTTNKICALQVGVDLGTDTTASTLRRLLRIGLGATPDYFISDLPWHESTTHEAVNCNLANMILSHKRFNIPAASDLRISAMGNAAGEARGFALYGVD